MSYKRRMRFAGMALAISVTSLAYADEGSKTEVSSKDSEKPSSEVLGARRILRDPSYKCKAYLHFQKPGDLYKYFTLTSCVGSKGTEVIFLLTNNCADTVYWTGLGARRYNGVYSTLTDYTDTKGPFLETILFHTSAAPLSVKIRPGETALPFNSDRIHNAYSKLMRMPSSLKPNNEPRYLPIEGWTLSPPYASIAMTFAGDEVKFSEVFVAVLAQN